MSTAPTTGATTPSSSYLSSEYNKIAPTDDSATNTSVSGNTSRKPAKDMEVLVAQMGVAAVQQRQTGTAATGEVPALTSPKQSAPVLSNETAAAIVKASDDLNTKKPATLAQLANAAVVKMSDDLNTKNPAKLAELAAAVTGAGLVNPQVTIAKNDNSAAKTASDDKGGYVNIIGSESAIKAQNAVSKALLAFENASNKQAAAEGDRMFKSAVAAGQHGIDAAQKNFTGAVVAGTVGTVLQGAGAFKQNQALRAESKSTKTNLASARQSQRDLEKSHQTRGSAEDTLKQHNTPMQENVRSAMGAHHADISMDISLKSDAHNQVLNKSQRTQSAVMFANQGIHAGEQGVLAQAGVQAAGDQKKADVARANQELHKDLGNTEDQQAKKAHEAKASILQALDSALTTNNNTISEMANK